MRVENTRAEVIAGITTFVTMSYIIFVQPAVLSTDFAGRPTGLDFGAVLLATCVVSGAATIVMGLWAKYPIALAPGMGENFFSSR
ncbi:MAG: solute carrier family 23 protein [Vicinamibacterales bacterium]